MDRYIMRQLVPAIAGTMTAMLPMETAPFLIGGAVHAGNLSVEAAGWVGTASVGAVAAASMAMSPLLGKIRIRTSVIGFGLTVAVSYGLMAFASSLLSFMILAIASGAACGGLLATMAMVVAGTPDPDRSYGVIYAATGVVFAALLFLLPAVGDALSTTAMFFLIAGVALTALPIASRVKIAAAAPDAVSEDSGRVNWLWVGLLILVMSIAFPIYGGIYGFAERKALEVGLSSVQAGMVISAATLLTIVGTLCVAAIGTRFGRLWPTLAVMALATVAYGLTLRATDPAGFITGFLIFGFMQLAMNSYFFGLASALDRAGKVAALLQGYSLVPYALGAGIFGSLAGNGPLTPLAMPAVAVNVTAAVLLLPLLVILDRRSGAASMDMEVEPQLK